MTIQRNDPCWCGSGKKWKQCHYPNQGTAKDKPFDIKAHYLKQHHILIKDERQIDGIRAACHLTAKILDAICDQAKEGITTLALNDFAHQLHLEAGAIPAPLHYGSPPFPKSICTSLNEVICHGIPDKTELRQGDILNIDIACIYKGYYGDCSRMVVIGKTTPERQLVVDVAFECLMRAVSILKPYIPISDIGEAIEPYAISRGCSVVNQFVGHGTGVYFHEGPQIPHFRNNLQTILVPGMTFTIEPMINAGVREGVIDPKNKWTARTCDNKASAQWEHTLLITESGYEILTPWKGGVLAQAKS
jgi:methionyl aminopeptidase